MTDRERRRRLLECSLGGTFRPGNEITLLRNGDRIFPAMLEAIATAERSIDFTTFVYWSGAIAERVARALAERARAGVRVRALIDGVGSLPMDEGLRRLMQEAGVDLRVFRPPSTWRVWRTSHRTHRKLLIVDGRVGFTGGVGVADEWDGDARNPGEWRETHLRVVGPVVDALGAAFLGNWMEMASDELPGDDDLAPVRSGAGGSDVLAVRSTAAVGWSETALLWHALIHSARRRLWIATPYFVPDARGLELLVEAAGRGVDVRVLTAGAHNDSRLSQLAGRRHVQDLLDADVRVGFYDHTMLHLKVITVDGEVACLGSANINRRSLQKDDEFCLIIDDPRLAAELDEDFEQDGLRARWPDAEAWRQRPWHERLLERLVQPLRSNL